MSVAEPPADILRQAERLRGEQRWADALALFGRLPPDRLPLQAALGMATCLFELGRFAEAEPWLLTIARHRPADPNVRRRLGVLYGAQGRLDAAEVELRTALAFDAGHLPSRLALGAHLLSVGRYAEGFPLLDGREKLSPDVVPTVNPSFPEWRGEPLAGKSVLVWVEQGFGDQIQMARFVNVMKAQGAKAITLACRPPLAALFATLAGCDTVLSVDLNTEVAVGRHDYWSRYFSLPARLGTTLETLPAAPYLSAPVDRRARWRGFPGKVGLVWQASPTGFNAANKGLTTQQAGRLAELGAVCLHPEETGAADFADTAAIIEGLDLVISMDTAVAHLAGAMGRPVWTLIPRLNTDWRWGCAGSTSPWYPTMRLYR